MKKINNPIKKFDEWYLEAKNCDQVSDHTEMCVSTANKSGKPSARIVLLKKHDERGFCFFTNYGGRKSLNLIENPFAAICFYWPALGKQIRIEGEVEKLSSQESDEYFMTRPRASRLGAWASEQSKTLASREEFENKLKELEKQFEDKEITRPEFWGGWRVMPNTIEFWEAQEFRYHHRELYEKDNNGNWTSRLLYP
jgi:pyridoxamine 5'-phosphate oxidase